MVLGDCASCTSQVLRFPHGDRLKKYAVCAAPGALAGLRRDWPKITIVSDPEHRILPAYSYLVTPQAFLIDNGKVEDAAIGALDCDAKLEKWNR